MEDKRSKPGQCVLYKSLVLDKQYYFLIAGAVFLPMLGLLGFISISLRVWDYTIDDAYIIFRYAGNFAKGWGLTFNEAPPRAEGYSSFLWTIIMVVPHLMGISAVLVSKVLGLLFTLASILVSCLAVYRSTKTEPIMSRVLGTSVAAVLLLSFPFIGLHAISGMETALTLFLYASVTALCIREHKGFWPIPIACLLLGLARPEANLFCGILLALYMLRLPKRAWPIFSLVCLLLYVLPGLTYFIGRYRYYGMAFPLPFYIKSGHLGLAGIAHTYAFVSHIAVGFTMPVLCAVLYDFRKSLVLLLPVVGLSAYLLTIKHIMGFGDRYFFPFLPVMAILGGIGCIQLLRTQQPAQYTKVYTLFLLMMGASLVVGFGNGWKSTEESLYRSQGLSRAHVLLGHALASIKWQTPDPVLVMGDTGAAPYFSQMRTIDSYGLNDAHIATHFEEDRSEYILSNRPTVVVLASTSPDVFLPCVSYEEPIYRSCLTEGFTSNAMFPVVDKHYLWVLWRPDSPDGDKLEAILRDASKYSQEDFKMRSK